MKKTLLTLAVSAMLLNSIGCGTCRNWFASRRAAPTPVVTQCMPSGPPMCCPPVCSDGFSGSPVMYGGGMMSGGMMSGGMMPSGMMIDGCECQ